MGAVEFEEVEPGGGRPAGRLDELIPDCGQSVRVQLARDLVDARPVREREAADTGQLPVSRGWSMPSHISLVEPLRPEWPSWTPMAAPGTEVWTKSVIRRQAVACSSVHRPVQPG